MSAVGLDTNSVNRNGYGLWTTSGNPPSAYWRKWEKNIAIEIFVGYSMVSGLSKLNLPSTSRKVLQRGC